MANTQKYKNQIETWFINRLKDEYPNHIIHKEKVDLIWGGKFEYDAVVREKANNRLKAVYCLSCSEYITEGGNPGAGKFQKIRADVLMMVGTNCHKKVLVFTGNTMFKKVSKEIENGRMPNDIILEYINLKEEKYDLFTLVASISADAVAEVTPKSEYKLPKPKYIIINKK